MTSFNPDHPLHRASFYLEDLKWGRDGWDAPDADPAVTGVNSDQAEAQLVALLRDAGIDADETELREAVEYYGRSWSKHTGVDPLIARSLFMDAFQHGVAFAAGLKGKIPAVYE